MTGIKKWVVLEERNASPSKWFPLFAHKVQLPNGKIVEDYYVSKLGDVAMIVAITPNKEIIFTKQYKHGVQEIILELPAGRIGNRTPENAAKEELREETGITADELVTLGNLYIAPSKDSTINHGFLLKNAEVAGGQHLDETENIELVFVPLKDLDQMIKSGEVCTADTIALITLAKLHFPELFR